ncbi:methyltransferase FkbM [Paenibacillus swuensis]|uniref:Methyltransferase FkbM n=1 Tax=Paenibacillus swuensis TaxID=1178515 RepID=A0A172TJA6_9BACL|nr:FkbM family methyltransferase [Paenibacillus swuensis]ANE46873.1 methyltransferase FkbM [Paenibacillus swuensis]
MAHTVTTVTKRNAAFDVVLRSHSSKVWSLINENQWEEGTFNVLDRFLNENFSYLDIGAWIGPTVLYGSHISKHVYALEPDAVAIKELRNNLKLNPAIAAKVTAIHAALSEKSGTASLYMRSAFGDSSSSLIQTVSDQSCSVKCMTIENLINKHRIKDLNFVKIDIEGSEYSLIPSMKPFLELVKPTLYLSLHPPFLIENLQRQYHSEAEVQARYNQIVETLIESLQMYKYIYDAAGTRIDQQVVLHESNYREYLFTNEVW